MHLHCLANTMKIYGTDKMKNIYYFLKWNFSGMQPYNKRFFAYVGVAILLALIFGTEAAIFWPIAMCIDIVITLVYDRYTDFKRDQAKMLDDLKG